MKKIFLNLILFVFCVLVMTVSLRGIAGNPTSAVINNPEWKENGPFELSPERGRFALALSLIENNSFYFSLPIARFATPDLGISNGNYVSLFAPAISFLILPGFWIGKMFNAGQFGAYAVISLFAIINVFLLRSIAVRLGSSQVAATIGSLIFLFATPAFAYGVNLYQHHVSTFLILFAFYLLIVKKGFVSLFLIWFLFAMSIPVDYPNLFLMGPIAIGALFKFFMIYKENTRVKIHFKFLYIFSFTGVILPLVFFMWFNFYSYGNPFQFSGTVASVKAIDENGKPALPQGIDKNNLNSALNPDRQKKSSIGFFQTRDLLNGFYIHFISPDRGIVYYAPVILFGLIGIIVAYRKKMQKISVLVSIIGVNVLLYSMWGDPWGGWAFGSRYLIPTYAILAIFISLLLTEWRKKILLFFSLAIVIIYSIAVNTLGAITTSALPPQVQVLELERISGIIQRYTYQRNWEFLIAGDSKSYFYNNFLSGIISALEFYQILTISISMVLLVLLFSYYLISRKEKNAGV